MKRLLCLFGVGALLPILLGGICPVSGGMHTLGGAAVSEGSEDMRVQLSRAAGSVGGSEYDGEQFVPGELIVMFKDGVSEAAVEELNSSLGTTVLYTSPYMGFKRIGIPADKTITEMVDTYSQDPRVEYAEPNAIARAFYTPNDTYFSYQWHFLNIRMQSAWDIQQGNSSVVVGILDTGIAYEDFAIPTWEQSEVLSLDSWYHIAPDLTSTSFVAGWDYINNDDHPNDENGHGTHVAGTVAQSTNNNYGVAGMAFGVSLMPIRVLGYDGSGSTDAIADGITGAKNNGAHVLNLSLGGNPGDSTGFHTVHLAMIDAWNSGVVICCATGNNGASQISYPAGWDECLAVGAVRFDSTRSPYSNYGPGISVVAPGGDVSVDQNGDGYVDGVLQETYVYGYDWGGGGELAWVDTFEFKFWQGTSMATPHAAALAALLVSAGATGPDYIASVIALTATDLGSPGPDLEYGFGLINPVAALNALGVAEKDRKLTRSLRFQAMPNPFSEVLTARYDLLVAGHAVLKVYDSSGRLARVLVDEESQAGAHSVNWDGYDDSGNRLPAGLYFLKLDVDREVRTRKITLIR